MFDFFKRQEAAEFPPEAKASATGKVIAWATGGRSVWGPRDAASLTRAGFTGNPVGFRAVKIISEAGRELGFQTILISHHDIDLFSQYADRVYRLDPQGDGSVRARIVGGSVTEDEVEAGPPRMPTNLFDEL